MTPQLTVHIHHAPGECRVHAADDAIVFQTAPEQTLQTARADFAAWLMLPVAMRRGADLDILGAGSLQTARHIERLSAIWARWVPEHFRPVRARFAQTVPPSWGAPPAAQGDLCFYSGGVDSTYMLLKRLACGERQSLLTLHGMDYKHDDEARFQAFIDKTTPFARLVSQERILLRTDAYEIYRKHRVNPRGSDVGHGFVLAAGAFLLSHAFGRAVLAADYRLDQQFDVHPWGTNCATNRCFDDGRFRIETACEDVGRTEKMELVSSSAEALASLTFCVDYGSRPHNCGRCQKCVRTKAMFMVRCGEIPDIFRYRPLAPDCLQAFDLRKPHQRVFMSDLFETAMLGGTLDRIPGLARYDPAYLSRQATQTGGRWRFWRR